MACVNLLSGEKIGSRRSYYKNSEDQSVTFTIELYSENHETPEQAVKRAKELLQATINDDQVWGSLRWFKDDADPFKKENK